MVLSITSSYYKYFVYIRILYTESMCIVFLWKQERKELLCNFKFILAANRDEYFNRPAKPANFWPGEPNIIGGENPTVFFNFL